MTTWAKIKERVAQYVQDHPEHEGAQAIQREADSQGRAVKEYLSSYDIRCVGALREHVRDAFPSQLKYGTLHCSVSNSGTWVVENKRLL